MTSDEIKKTSDYEKSTVHYRHVTLMPLWEIAYQLAVQAEQQAKTLKLMERSVSLQEVVHLARPAELETLHKWKESSRQAWAAYDKAKGELDAAEQEIKILKKDRSVLARALADPQQGKSDSASERGKIAAALRSCALTIEENHLGESYAADYLRKYADTVEKDPTEPDKSHPERRDNYVSNVERMNTGEMVLDSLADPQQGKRDAVSERGETPPLSGYGYRELYNAAVEACEVHLGGKHPILLNRLRAAIRDCTPSGPVDSTNQPSPAAAPAETSTATETSREPHHTQLQADHYGLADGQLQWTKDFLKGDNEQ